MLPPARRYTNVTPNVTPEPRYPKCYPRAALPQMLPQSRVTPNVTPEPRYPKCYPRAALPPMLPQSRVTPNVTPEPRYPQCYPRAALPQMLPPEPRYPKVTPRAGPPMPPLSYAVASRLLQRSSCLELIQNRKGVERTASNQKRKIDRAQGRRTQRSSTL